jgi:hypothetical protein
VFDSQSFVVLLFVSKYESVKFGRIQFLQNQLSVDIERLLYSLTVISMHFIWCQNIQSSHWIPRWLLRTGLSHFPHGFLTGPGFSATSPLIKTNTPEFDYVPLTPNTSAVNIEFETVVNNDIFTELKEVRKRHPNHSIVPHSRLFFLSHAKSDLI